ncbi:unnamed protein product [Closterium sp. Naga37s-1]|nr:unnamed protein product [Closterium sp. Naga37s-1]
MLLPDPSNSSLNGGTPGASLPMSIPAAPAGIGIEPDGFPATSLSPPAGRILNAGAAVFVPRVASPMLASAGGPSRGSPVPPQPAQSPHQAMMPMQQSMSPSMAPSMPPFNVPHMGQGLPAPMGYGPPGMGAQGMYGHPGGGGGGGGGGYMHSGSPVEASPLMPIAAGPRRQARGHGGHAHGHAHGHGGHPHAHAHAHMGGMMGGPHHGGGVGMGMVMGMGMGVPMGMPPAGMMAAAEREGAVVMQSGSPQMVPQMPAQMPAQMPLPAVEPAEAAGNELPHEGKGGQQGAAAAHGKAKGGKQGKEPSVQLAGKELEEVKEKMVRQVRAGAGAGWGRCGLGQVRAGAGARWGRCALGQIPPPARLSPSFSPPRLSLPCSVHPPLTFPLLVRPRLLPLPLVPGHMATGGVLPERPEPSHGQPSHEARASPRPPSAPAPPLRASAAVHQVEFYLSDQNLPTDNHLMKLVRKDPDGYVPLKIIAEFRKIRALVPQGSPNVAVVNLLAAALRASPFLVVGEDGKKVRRAVALGEVDLEEVQARTVVAENLPEDHSIPAMEALFAKAGKVKMVRVCKPEAANSANQAAIAAAAEPPSPPCTQPRPPAHCLFPHPSASTQPMQSEDGASVQARSSQQYQSSGWVTPLLLPLPPALTSPLLVLPAFYLNPCRVKMVRVCKPEAANSANQAAIAAAAAGAGAGAGGGNSGRHGHKQHAHHHDLVVTNKLHALVEYESVEEAERAVEMLTDENNWRSGLHVRLLIRKPAHVLVVVVAEGVVTCRHSLPLVMASFPWYALAPLTFSLAPTLTLSQHIFSPPPPTLLFPRPSLFPPLHPLSLQSLHTPALILSLPPSISPSFTATPSYSPSILRSSPYPPHSLTHTLLLPLSPSLAAHFPLQPDSETSSSSPRKGRAIKGRNKGSGSKLSGGSGSSHNQGSSLSRTPGRDGSGSSFGSAHNHHGSNSHHQHHQHSPNNTPPRSRIGSSGSGSGSHHHSHLHPHQHSQHHHHHHLHGGGTPPKGGSLPSSSFLLHGSPLGGAGGGGILGCGSGGSGEGSSLLMRLPPGPRMPDGTKGFAMGRGKRLPAAT